MANPNSYLMPNQGAANNPVSSVPDGQATIDLGNLLDVLAPTPSDGQVITFVASAGKWMPVSPGDSSVTAPLTLTGATDAVQLSVVGNATQTNDLFKVLDHTGVYGLVVFDNGEVAINSTGSDGLLMSSKQITLLAAGDDPSDAVNYSQLTAIGWQGAWVIGTTYAKSAIVTGSDAHCYISISAANVGNDPTTDAGAHWHALNS